MNELFSLPHFEVLALITGLGIASAAGWTANAMLRRAKLMERDVDALRYEIRRLRHHVVPPPGAAHDHPALSHAYQAAPMAAPPAPQPQPEQVTGQTQFHQAEAPRLQPIRLTPMPAPEPDPMQQSAARPAAPQPHAVSFGRPAAETPVPDIKKIAEQLGMQSSEAIGNLLSGQLSLGAAAREMGTGRQEARLLYWLHGRASQEQPNA